MKMFHPGTAFLVCRLSVVRADCVLLVLFLQKYVTIVFVLTKNGMHRKNKVVALNSDFGMYRVADTYWKEKQQIQRHLNQYKKGKYHLFRNRSIKIIRLR